ncbi:MAG: hypothetical protein NT075_35175 [Chloroflexi bacterium]|nr:hypothetical protein [Chloroflexota bacterium]
MQLITTLTSDPNALAVDSRGQLYLAESNAGLQRWDGLTFTQLLRGPARDVKITLANQLYATVGDAIYTLDLNAPGALVDLTERFGGAPSGQRRICCAHDGVVWVEGCPQQQMPDGTFQSAPQCPIANLYPIPLAHDQHGNDWSLVDHAGDYYLLVRAADKPAGWQSVPLPDASQTEWFGLLADECGFLWLAGTTDIYRLNPRRQGYGWVKVESALLTELSTVSSLACSPAGKALLGFATGEHYEADINAAGETLLTRFATLAPATPAVLYTDGRGAVWAGTATGLFYQPPIADAWQQHWTAMGRLPSGNHDIFAATIGEKLFISGGLTSGYGHPAVSHVFDELYQWDAPTQPWRVISQMPFPRCYNGIAYFAEQLWIVGGSANLREPGNPDGPRDPLASVVIYNPDDGQWNEGPTLQNERIEPVVLVAQNRLYTIGGSDAQKVTLDSVESMGPGESAWQYVAPLPVAMRQFAGCELDGQLYVCGKAGFFAYDPATDRWDASLPQLPVAPQAPLMTAHRGEIWVLGGYPSKETWRFSPQTRRWQRGPDLPTEQSWAAAASHLGRLLIIGGAHWSAIHQLFVFDDRTYFYNE